MELTRERVLLALDSYEHGIRESRILLECELITTEEFDQKRRELANQVRATYGAPPLQTTGRPNAVRVELIRRGGDTN